ncbi:MAG: DUF3322 domain-containing protein [Gammaproteobacteria bacterium]
MSWTTGKDLRQQVQQLWDKGRLLSSMLDDDAFFPRRLTLKTPSSRELSQRYGEARRWIASLQKVAGIRIELKLIRHPVLGENAVPKAAWLDNLQQAVQIIGKQQQCRQFADLITLIRERQPALLPWLKTQPLQALALFEEWPRLLAVVGWMRANPRPGIYLRQVDIPGVDSKFIERHRGVLTALLDQVLTPDSIDQDARGVSRFEARFGFLQKPLRVRFRLLDPDIRLLPGANRDIALTRQGFHDLALNEGFRTQIETVFITENETNFLTFPEVENSLVLFGAGYGFDALAGIPWLSGLHIYYWGDIDTHGFAILNQLRTHLPQAHSLLMDETTLLAHQSFWEQEGSPESRDLARLTPEERRLYDALRTDRFAKRLRLEQERIGFNWLKDTLKQEGWLAI